MKFLEDNFSRNLANAIFFSRESIGDEDPSSFFISGYLTRKKRLIVRFAVANIAKEKRPQDENLVTHSEMKKPGYLNASRRNAREEGPRETSEIIHLDSVTPPGQATDTIIFQKIPFARETTERVIEL